MTDEKEIGGQLEVVRYQADRVIRAMDRMTRLVPSLDAESLSKNAAMLRLCAAEVENLNQMISKYQKETV